jgi:hypothetical protein
MQYWVSVQFVTFEDRAKRLDALNMADVSMNLHGPTPSVHDIVCQLEEAVLLGEAHEDGTVQLGLRLAVVVIEELRFGVAVLIRPPSTNGILLQVQI